LELPSVITTATRDVTDNVDTQLNTDAELTAVVEPDRYQKGKEVPCPRRSVKGKGKGTWIDTAP